MPRDAAAGRIVWRLWIAGSALMVGVIGLAFSAQRSLARHQTDAALLAAVKAENIAGAERALDGGAKIEARYPLDWWSKTDWADDDLTPLALAVHRGNGGNAAMVRMLVSRGANVQAKTRADSAESPPYDTVLCDAVSTCDADTVRFLIAKGAQVDARGGMGVTPLMMAARDNRLETVKLLLQDGAGRNIRDERGFTPLDFALAKHRHDHSRVARILRDAGARS